MFETTPGCPTEDELASMQVFEICLPALYHVRFRACRQTGNLEIVILDFMRLLMVWKFLLEFSPLGWTWQFEPPKEVLRNVPHLRRKKAEGS